MPFTKSLSFSWEQPPDSYADGSYFQGLEDTLGCYPDGIKRTLTDDQISMFRHSEIHDLLRQQATEKEYGARPESHSSGLERSASHGHFCGSSHARALSPGITDEGPHPESEEEENEEEYQRFLTTEREQLSSISERMGQRPPKPTYFHDRTRSTRRLVRELDEIQDTPNTLDYGDGDGANILSESGNANEGRKIWWPKVGP